MTSPRFLVPLTLLSLVAACGTKAPSITGVTVTANFSTPVDQLELSVRAGSTVVVAPMRRPAAAGAPLATPQSVSIFLSDDLADTNVTCAVTAYSGGVAVLEGSKSALLERHRLVSVTIDLAAPQTGDAGADAEGGAGGTAGTGGSGGGGTGGDTGGTGGGGTGGGGSAGGGAGGGGAGGSGAKPNGTACLSPGECESNLCIDGFCCGGICGICTACNLKGFEGMCAPLPTGTKSSKCVDQGAQSCGFDGTCNGGGACRKYDQGTPCKAASCQGSAFLPPSACDGMGACVAANSVSCAPYLCDSSGGAPACRTTCQAGVVGCASPATCTNGSCGAKVLKADGDGCVADGDCMSTHCADGVCCATACTGACVACDLTGFVGKCHDVDAGKADPHKVCKDAGASTCKQTGLCNGAGACALYAATTTCLAGTCSGRMLVGARRCDGNGTCLAATQTDCLPFRCDTATTACFTSCTTNAQCSNAPKRTCSAPNCQ